jgi:hypothetical protein
MTRSAREQVKVDSSEPSRSQQSRRRWQDQANISSLINAVPKSSRRLPAPSLTVSDDSGKCSCPRRLSWLVGHAKLPLMLRRLAALMTGLLMAHLTFVGSDFACAVHPGDMAGVPHGMAHHGHSATTSGTAATESAPCRTPVVPMCCQGLTSCAPMLSLTEAAPAARVMDATKTVSESVRDLPLSEIIAPDPPPPRA